MAWDVLADEDFAAWLLEQPDRVQVRVAAAVLVLSEFGPQLGRPRVDTVYGSAFDNMKELRVKVGRSPYRILFAFDPIRRAVLLVGGDKGCDKRWYDVNIPIADDRFQRHLRNLMKDEADDGDPL
jgi:hypothetical protein